MLDLEVFVSEFLSENGLASSSVSVGEVTSLGHKVRDDSVEGASLISETLLAGTESSEVLGGLWHHGVEQFEDDSACALASNLYVEENFGHA